MRFASSISGAESVQEAVAELLAPIDRRVTPGMVDLALCFFTSHFRAEAEQIAERIGAMFPSATVIGCTADGTIGLDRELERIPSISLLAGSLPDVVVRPFHIREADLAEAKSPAHWERLFGVGRESQPAFIALGDPFRVPLHGFVDRINEAFPKAPLLGGVASGAHEPDGNALVLNDAIHTDGIVGVSLSGAFEVAAVVSQGCRPIGKSLVITKGERNVVHHLGGKPALEQLRNVLESLSEEDEQLARQSLFVGRVIDEFKPAFTRGDFLIHNILGADRKTGSMAIAGYAKVGATVQFHVRDAASADEDLRTLLTKHAGRDVRGGLLFGCNGRGTNMWPQPGHDVGVLREVFPDLPVAGFFCGGEFGPIGDKNFIHGFTASIALFLERS